MNKKAYKTFGNNLVYTMQFSGVLTLLLLVVYLALYFLDSLVQTAVLAVVYSLGGIFIFIGTMFLISVVFNLFAPFVYSYFASNITLQTSRKDDVTVKNFFKTYSIGRKYPIKGQLKMFSNTFFAFLIFIVLFIITLFLSSEILYFSNIGGFKEITDNIASEIAGADANSIMNVYEKYSSSLLDVLKNPMIYCAYVSSLPAIYYFAHNVNLYIFKYYITTSIYGLNPKGTHYVFKSGLRKCRKDFYKDYYFTLWPLSILMILLYSLSFFLIAFFTPLGSKTYALIITSMFLTLSVMLIFMPVSFNLFDDMYKKYQSVFINTFIEQASIQLKQAKSNYERFNESEKAALEENEKQLKDITEKLKQREEQDHDSSDDDSSKS